MEQLKVDWCDVVVLSMSGDLTSGDTQEGFLKGSFDDLMDGKYCILAGHPESFETQEGKRILNELSRRGRILMVVIDEVHTNLHW